MSPQNQFDRHFIFSFVLFVSEVTFLSFVFFYVFVSHQAKCQHGRKTAKLVSHDGKANMLTATLEVILFPDQSCLVLLSIINLTHLLSLIQTYQVMEHCIYFHICSNHENQSQMKSAKLVYFNIIQKPFQKLIHDGTIGIRCLKYLLNTRPQVILSEVLTCVSFSLFHKFLFPSAYLPDYCLM